MKVFLRQLSDHSLVAQKTVSVKELGLPEDIFDCLGPLAVSGKISRAGDAVIGIFEVSGKYRLSCSRCLTDLENEKTDRFEIIIDIEPMTEFVDFADDIRQEMILAMTLKPLCRQDCKGLCPGCGSNLNLEKCKCNTSD
jgi:uncharacterized protein